MQSKLLIGCISALLFIAATISASAQAVYAASEGHSSLSVGAGFSGFDQDWGHNPLVYGGTLWVDWRPPFFSGLLQGLNLEMLARDASLNRGSYPPMYPVVGGRPGLPRTDILGGDLLYHPRWVRFHKFEPYIKGGMAFGSIDFTLSTAPNYSHDTRTVSLIGGGVDYRLIPRITLRGDYEYQWWPGFLGPNALNPQGFTVGALYNFGHR